MIGGAINVERNDPGNVTLHLLRYREATRHLWNTFLRQDGTSGLGSMTECDLLDDWESLQKTLFSALVLRHTGQRAHLRVVPTGAGVPAMISRAKPAQTYWDHSIRQLSPSDDLRFIDFFDFDQSSFLDFAYYRVSIHASEMHPELVGHEALIEVQYANVFVQDS
jgi:hypothetical protein